MPIAGDEPGAGSPDGLPPAAGPYPPLPVLPVPAAPPVPAGVGLPAMRMPHVSQKSSLAESCPLGQIAIGASWIRRSPLRLFPRPDRLGRPGIEGHLIGVLDLLA